MNEVVLIESDSNMEKQDVSDFHSIDLRINSMLSEQGFLSMNISSKDYSIVREKNLYCSLPFVIFPLIRTYKIAYASKSDKEMYCQDINLILADLFHYKLHKVQQLSSAHKFWPIPNIEGISAKVVPLNFSKMPRNLVQVESMIAGETYSSYHTR